MMKCRGCQREELHKMCPAHGTLYYMSGKEFTPEMEKALKGGIYHSPTITKVDDIEVLEFKGPTRIVFYMDSFNPKVINNDRSFFELLRRIALQASACYRKGKKNGYIGE